MQAPYLVGEKVYLRALDRTDAPRVQKFLNDPEVRPTIASWRPITLESEIEWLDRMGRSENDVQLGIAVKDSDELVGVCALHQIDWRERSASFGIVIGEPLEWGKGYGTEATRLVTEHGFDRLNLNRIWLHVYTGNDRGIRAYETVGYRREGVLRQGAFRGGRYVDVVVMAMLAEEWRAKPAGPRAT